MKATELILALQKLVEQEGNNVEVYMTESGYYSDGNIADIYPPKVYKFCHYIDDQLEHVEVWSIGHSHQSY